MGRAAETGGENRGQEPKGEQRTNLNIKPWDLPGGPIVKTSPSNAGVVGSVPGPGG